MSILTAIFVKIMLVQEFETSWIQSRGFAYNSPLLIISAVAFLLFFRNLRIKSRVINRLASSVLAIYLITESWAGKRYLYPFVNDMGKQVENGWLLALYLFTLSIIIVIGCLLADKLRMLISKPVEKLICKIPVEKWIKTGVDKVSEFIK